MRLAVSTTMPKRSEIPARLLLVLAVRFEAQIGGSLAGE
jgi:hypothetical protein